MARKKSIPSNSPKVAQTPIQASHNRDGWGNVVTGLGAINSRVNSTKYNPNEDRLHQNTLTSMYANDGLARRVVNVLVDDAMRTFIHCEKELLDELGRLNVKRRTSDGLTWARLYGGSVAVIFADDGQEMDKPLNLERLKKVVSIRVYDRYQISWLSSDSVINFYDEAFGEPDTYTITPTSGTPFKVHRSRLHLFRGARVSNLEYVRNNRWDASVLQSVYESLRNYGQSMNATAEIVQDFIQRVLGINGLTDMLRQGNESEIVSRACTMDLTASIAQTVFLDSEHETYTKHASSVSGLAELCDRFSEAIAGATGIPITKLLGRSPSGLNSTSKGDENNWNNIVDEYRSDSIAPFIDWLIKILEAQTIWEDKRPTNYEWSFPSLKTANESEDVKNRLLTAQLDQIYIDRGSVDPEFLFKKRYAGGSYEIDIVINENELEDSSVEDDIDMSEVLTIKEANKETQTKNDALELKEKSELQTIELCNKILEKL